MLQSLKERLILYMDAGFPILYIDTFEDDKADEAIIYAAGNREVIEWNDRGLFFRKENIQEKRSLEEALDNFINPGRLEFEDLISRYTPRRKILVLKDIRELWENREIIARLKYLSQQIVDGTLSDFNIVVVASRLKIPQEMEWYVTVFSIDSLSGSEIAGIIEEFCREQELPPLDRDFLRELSLAFLGLPAFEIKNILALAIAGDGGISRSDMKLIHEQKKQLIQKSGIMEMVTLEEDLEIGGLENLKEWLKRKAEILRDVDKARSFGVDLPKGVLIAGLPGCGKSSAAKAAALLFKIPLLRLDMGRLMGKYVGESEGNLRQAIALAEAISPCVLWIDELEKAFAGIGGSGGGAEVTTRLFGTFLTWMQEKRGMAFVVATANDVSKLPPELLRKGRFDEVFYVDLPNERERQDIFSIHIRKRRPEDIEGKSLDLAQLARETAGYSGADIEGAVREAIETAFIRQKDKLTMDILLETVKNTASLSKTMKKSIEEMAKIYKDINFKSASK